MRKFLFSLALTLLAGQTASATPELFLVSGSTTLVVPGSGPNVVFQGTSFGGWDIGFGGIFGVSDSPATKNPFGLTLELLGGVTCNGGACDTNPLHVWMSDTGFTDQNTAFDNIYMGASAIDGITEQIAWVGPGNIPFQSNGADGPPTVAGGPLISVVGPFHETPGMFEGSKTGGPAAGPSPYSLTIEQTFTAITGQAIFGAIAGEVTAAVPEPASIALLGGGVLLLGALRLRRRKV